MAIWRVRISFWSHMATTCAPSLRLNRDAYPDACEALKKLADKGVKLRVCRNTARSRGYAPEDFYDLFTVVPAAVIDIAKWGNAGYSYMYAELFPRMTREDIVA